MVIFNGRDVEIVIEGVDKRDYPKFCDAYIEEGYYVDTGIELTEAELDELMEQIDMSYWAYETLY